MRQTRRSKSRRHFGSALLVAAGLLVALPACESRVDVRGQMLDPELIAEVRPGQSTRDDVLALLGTPSTLSNFKDDTWYYIGQRSEQFAFFRPEVTDRRILQVTFGPDGFVEDTRVLNLEDGQDVELVQRETPTEGREMTLLQQLLGNIGRFPGQGEVAR